MSSNLEFETFFYISSDKLLLCVFKKGLEQEFYKDETRLDKDSKILETSINQFLDKNIIIIEKKIKNFVNKINLVIKDKDILPIQISIKKQNIEKNIMNEELNYMLSDLSQQIKKNNDDKTILHMNIDEYIVDGTVYKRLEEGLEGENLTIKVNFYCFSNIKVKKFAGYLKRFQISINKVYSIDYLKNFFFKSDLSECQMARKIEDLDDINEIKFVPRLKKNIGFFEKFFNLFNK